MLTEAQKDPKPKTILLVEDEAVIAVAESRMLQRKGYEVLTAYDGERALEIALSDSVDLILMDIDLGSGAMDGTETASRILERKELPIVFLSSHTEPEVVERTERITSYGYVVKNSGDTILDASIKMAFKLHEAKQEVLRRRSEIELAVRDAESRELRLQHSNRVLHSIRNINQIINQDPGRDQLLEKTCSFLVEESGYGNAWIVLLEGERTAGTVFHAGFDGKSFAGIPERLRQGELLACVHAALSEGGVIITENPASDCPGCPLRNALAAGFPEFEGNAGITARIGHGSTVYGWLSVSAPRRYSKDPDERSLFQEIVNDLGYALHKNEIEIKTRKAEEVRLRAEENLKATLNSIGDAVISTDEKGKVTRMNPVAERLTGWSLPSALGKPLPEVFRIVHAHTGQEAANPVEKVLETGAVIGLANHTVLVSKNGVRRQIADSGAPIRDSRGDIAGVVLVFRDVTEEYGIRDALALNEDRLRKTLLAANDGTWDWDLVTNTVDFDRRYYEMAGYVADEFPHRLEEFQKRIHPEDRPVVMQTAERHLQGRLERFEVEFRFEKRNGGWLWVLGRGVIVERSEDGKPLRFVGTHTDITRIKAVEETLRTERRRLTDVLEGTHVGSWEWNVQSGELVVNERWADIVGYTLEELSPISIDTWSRLVHPEDREKSNALLEQHFRGELEYYECEARMRHKDGRWVWVLDRGRTASRTKNGEPLIASGTHLDISERKEAERLIQTALGEKENLLKELQHRVKNSFSLIISMLSLKSGSALSDETRDALDTMSARVRAIAELYSMLYAVQSSRQVRLDEYCMKVVESLRHCTEGVRIETQLENICAPIREAATVGLIATELITNALNHAFSPLEQGRIELSLENWEGRIRLTVKNNGRTFPDGFDIAASGGQGLQLVRAMAEQHEGTLRIERGEKTAVVVELSVRY